MLRISLPQGRRFSLLFLLSIGSVFGCRSVEAEKDAHEPTRMIVTRDSKGVQMQFQSVEGLRYTIYYRDAGIANDEWKQLPGVTEIVGTGELILAKDPSPRAAYRKYRIHSLVPVRRKDLK